MSIGPDAASKDKDRIAARLTAPAAEVERRDQAAPGKGPDRRLSRVDRRYGVERRHTTAEQAADYAGPERRERKIFVFGTVTYEQCCAA